MRNPKLFVTEAELYGSCTNSEALTGLLIYSPRLTLGNDGARIYLSQH